MNSKRPHNLTRDVEGGPIEVEKSIVEEETLKPSFSYQIREADGTLVEDSGTRPCRSFVVGFAKLLFNTLFELSLGSIVAITDTSGNSVSSYSGVYNSGTSTRTNAGSATSTHGLQVGTGTTAEAIGDTSLVTQIAHGTSSGQLQYGAMSYGAPTTDATTTTFRFTRVFTNGSGGTINVQEIGLVSGTGSRFLWLRDVTGSIAVNNGQSLTLNVDFTTTI